MAFVQFSKVSLAFGDRDILKNVSINLQAGTKAALTGANGEGKSTLIKVMAGIIPADSGTRAVQKDARIGYLPQSGLTHAGRTLLEEADTAFQFGYDMQTEIDRIGEELSLHPERASDLAVRQAALITSLDESGWHRRRAQAEAVLSGLGFSREDFTKRTEAFSGGWQMRIALAKVLMQNPDILLLDEPTNYLDIEARTWLEKFLQAFKGGFLLVSHDRYFLDVSVTEVYELFGGELKRYPGNFTHYEAVRKTELKTLIASYEQQQKEIRHLEEFIRRFGAKATKASQAQERQKQLDKIQRIEIPESMKKIRFTFPPAPHAGKVVLRINGVTKSYDGEHNVLDKLDVTIENGDRLVVAGHNGAGKSTLLRIIAGEDTSFSGELVFGSGVRTGYFSQDSSEEISGSESIIDYIESVAPLEMIPKVRDMLGAFLFRGDDVFKSLDVLSGGEKNRIALLKLLLEPVNFLVLDEPTNHLDMHSKDVLMQALKDFGGTVVFVSHDRGFIEGLSTRVVALEKGRYRIFPGDYAYYFERIEAEKNGSVAGMPFPSAADRESGTTSRTLGTAAAGAALFPARDEAASSDASKTSPGSEIFSDVKGADGGGQLSWEQAKKKKAEQRKLEREVERLEAEIASLEVQKTECENELAKPEVYASGERSRKVQKRLADVQEKLTALGIEWEKAAENAERAKAQKMLDR